MESVLSANSIGISLLCLVFLVIFRMLFNSPFFKAKFGECKVKRILSRNLKKDSYHIVNNVILTTDSGTTQIDHIVISKFGLFVIETKNISGLIFGNEKDTFWTQISFLKKIKFQNPLHQNYKHIKILAYALKLNEKIIYQVVSFTGKYTFKNAIPAKVINANQLSDYIKNRDNILLKNEEVNELTTKIEFYKSKTSFKTELEHILYIKNRGNYILNKKITYFNLIYQVIIKNIICAKIIILILLITFIYSILLLSNYSNNKYSRFLSNNFKKIEMTNTLSKNKREARKNKEEKTLDNTVKSGNPIYSWRDEKGIKVYSTTGFPENERYTEAIIEWQ